MTPPFPRVTWIVLDSVGAGEMPDAAAIWRRGQRYPGPHRFRPRVALAEHGAAGLGQSEAAGACGSRRIIPAPHSENARWHRPARTPPPAIGRWWAFISRSRFHFFRTDFRPRSCRNSRRASDAARSATAPLPAPRSSASSARNTCAPASRLSTPRPTAFFKWPRTKK